MDGRAFYVYMLASQRNGTLYVGVTSDLAKRLEQHRSDHVSSFACRYRIHRLVWYELHESAYDAISREKQLKRWNRAWKIELIEAMNPYWSDLATSLA